MGKWYVAHGWERIILPIHAILRFTSWHAWFMTSPFSPGRWWTMWIAGRYFLLAEAGWLKRLKLNKILKWLHTYKSLPPYFHRLFSTAQTGLKLMISLIQSPECEDYRHVPSYLIKYIFCLRKIYCRSRSFFGIVPFHEVTPRYRQMNVPPSCSWLIKLFWLPQ